MSSPVFKDKLNRLFAEVHPPGRGPYKITEVALATGLSVSYLRYLRDGSRDNPSMRQVAALARFFGVPAGYFFSGDLADEPHDGYLPLRAALQRASVRRVATRLPRLSDAALDAIDVLAGHLLLGSAAAATDEPAFDSARAD